MGEPSVNRLTEPQREVLRLWHHRQSAKQIALELGITHWAVNERLRSARRSLGAASSSEAARMLAESEAKGTYKRFVYDAQPIAESAKPDILEGSVGMEEGSSRRLNGVRMVREERVPFEAQAFPSVDLGLPLPRFPGDRNGLTVAQRLFWIGALTLGLALAVGALVATSWGVVRMFSQITRALS